MGFHTIAAALNAEGFQTRTSKRWHGLVRGIYGFASDLEEMVAERGQQVITRWVLHFGPILNDLIRCETRRDQKVSHQRAHIPELSPFRPRFQFPRFA